MVVARVTPRRMVARMRTGDLRSDPLPYLLLRRPCEDDATDDLELNHPPGNAAGTGRAARQGPAAFRAHRRSHGTGISTMFLVAGATSNTGRRVVDGLLQLGKAVRVMVRAE